MYIVENTRISISEDMHRTNEYIVHNQNSLPVCSFFSQLCMYSFRGENEIVLFFTIIYTRLTTR